MPNRTKVLFFIPNLVSGGAERVSITLLKKLDPKRYDIHLVVLSKEGVASSFLPPELKMIELNRSKTIYSVFRLREVIKQIQPDIIFSSLIRGHIALYLALKGLSDSIKVVFRSPTSPKLAVEERLYRGYMRKLIESAYRRADTVIAQTPEMKEELTIYHGVDPDNIIVLKNPLDTAYIQQSIQDITDPFENNRINVVAAGRLAKEKGFHVLLKAFQQVVKQNADFMLHIIGDDKGEEKNLKALQKELGLEEPVKFWDYQSNPYRFYYYCDLFVLSSLREGLPNTLLENLYLQKPVVATRCVSFVEQLVNDGENGLLVEINDSEALANAILNYKVIQPSLDSDIDDDQRVEQIFTTL